MFSRFFTVPPLLIAGFAASLLSACESTSPVGFQVPLTRLELPEANSRPLSIGAAIGSNNYVLLSPDQNTISPVNRQAEFGHRGDLDPTSEDDDLGDAFDVELDQLFSTRLDLQPISWFSIGIRTHADGLVSGSAKAYLLGRDIKTKPRQGDYSLAVTHGWGHSRATTNGSNTSTTVVRDYGDAALIGGYRFQPNLLVYGGPFYSKHDYRGSHTRTGITQGVSGDVYQRGANIGVALDVDQRFRLMLEFVRAAQTARNGNAAPLREYTNEWGLAFEFLIGGTLKQ